MKNAKVWVLGYCSLVAVVLAFIGAVAAKIDPFFHYHAPDMEHYFYTLDNERSQNNGIVKHFEYDGIITGTSMIQNFKTSEAEARFGMSFIKVPYSGGSFKEINDNLKIAFACHPNIKMVIRGLDLRKFCDHKDTMRGDLGRYPTYLYDDDVLNDVQYLLNRDVVFQRVLPMLRDKGKADYKGGITSFDEYSYWMERYSFGIHTLYPNGVTVQTPVECMDLTLAEREKVLANVHANITDTAKEHPDVTFYYFMTPYSVQWWQSLVEKGKLKKQIQAEEILIQECLKCENIKLFSFNLRKDITSDLNHYKDESHYAAWINSLMLKYMQEGKYLLTKETYQPYLAEEFDTYASFDYESINEQEDYENDYYAEALMHEEISGVKPMHIDLQDEKCTILSSAEITSNGYNGQCSVLCSGTLPRDLDLETPISSYLRDTGYIGFQYRVQDITPYQYLVFYGKSVDGDGKPIVFLYNAEGKIEVECTSLESQQDIKWHQYLVDISDQSGECIMIFHGGGTNNTCDIASQYLFSDVGLY